MTTVRLSDKPRRSIGITFFVVLLGTLLIVISVLAGLFRLSLGRGLDDYLARIELTRLDRVEDVLQRRYQHHGDWSFVRGPRDLLPPRGAQERPPPQRDPDDPRPLPMQGDLLGIGPRLILFDAGGQHLAGPPHDPHRPRRAIHSMDDGRVIGFLALAGAPGNSDMLASEFLRAQTRNLLWIALVGLVVSAIAAAWLAHSLRQPIHALMLAARQLASGKLNARAHLHRSDELGMLADDFNRMAEQIEQYEHSRRQWVADTSHELRTPLTVLRAHSEAMRDGVMPLDARGLDRIDATLAEMERLVTDLHQLARADVGQLGLKPVSLDLPALIEEVAAQFAAPMQKSGLTLEVHAHPAILNADPDRLQQVLVNALGNSLRYTDRGGIVHISCQQNGPLTDILIEDSAPGVPDAALPRLFERFYRVDASRNRAQGGSGLGLAICKSIVESHGGQISASHSQLGGLCLRILLPTQASYKKAAR
ncbi:HAMP domain-containing protein [Burkholderiaceae bacterium DAT-1]|nr:HAMP domain-containing protein [Burkholderiaceae bacterium DAT-1]